MLEGSVGCLWLHVADNCGANTFQASIAKWYEQMHLIFDSDLAARRNKRSGWRLEIGYLLTNKLRLNPEQVTVSQNLSATQVHRKMMHAHICRRTRSHIHAYLCTCTHIHARSPLCRCIYSLARSHANPHTVLTHAHTHM